MRIRVATLNVWGLPEPFSERLSGRLKAIGERIAALDVDVVAFQEVWTSGARRRLRRAGRGAGLVHAWSRHSSINGSGLLVLSRLPIESHRFDRFSLRGYPERVDHADYYGGKGFAQIRLRTDEGPITIINTHLHARHSSDIAHAYRGHRTGQIVELGIASLAIRDPIITMGDFNFREDTPEYAVLTGLTGMRDVAAELDRRRATIWAENAYRAARRESRRIDYVFTRDGAHRGVIPIYTERVFDEPFHLSGQPASYSDHGGVLAELEISDRPQPVAGPLRHAIELASEMLSTGRADAKERQRDSRAWAGVGLASAALASVGIRSLDVNRRRLLRLSLQGVAVAALAPSVGFSVLSEVFAPDEIRAFDAIAARLSRMQPDILEETLA